MKKKKMPLAQRILLVIWAGFLAGGLVAVSYADQSAVRACMIGAVTCVCIFGLLRHIERVAINRTGQ